MGLAVITEVRDFGSGVEGLRDSELIAYIDSVQGVPALVVDAEFLLDNDFWGPLKYGSNVYAIAEDDTTRQPSVRKRTPFGSGGWTELDATNVFGGATDQKWKSFWQSTSTITFIFYDGFGSTVAFQDFSLASETYGAVYGTSGAPAFGSGAFSSSVSIIGRRSDGSIIVVVAGTFSFNPSVYWTWTAGGGWSLPTTFESTDNVSLLISVWVDAQDRCHLLYQNSSGAFAGYNYNSIDATGVLGARQNIPKVSTSGGYFYYAVIADDSADKVYVVGTDPGDPDPGVGRETAIIRYIGSSRAAPTFTSELVCHAPGDPITGSMRRPFPLFLDGNFTIVFITQSPGNPGGDMMAVYTIACLSGVWQTPQLFFDGLVYDPSFGFSIRTFSAGNISTAQRRNAYISSSRGGFHGSGAFVL